jgi:UDP-2,3-diacylglucosamine hydrolase
MNSDFETNAQSITPNAASHVGLLAGWGRFPLDVARALLAQGCRVSCLGVKDHADPELIELCDDFQWIGLAKLGGGIRYFRRLGLKEATMAGKFHKRLLYQPNVWLRHLPDWRTIRAFAPHWLGSKVDRKDDTLLGVIVKEFAKDGIRFQPATDYAPELLVKPGVLTGGQLSAIQQADIQFGWILAKELGRLDVGQSVCVKGRGVLAVEAIEGTDECIRRAGLLCPAGGFTVVKTAKPQQDMRFDVPTIGLGTLQTMVAAGAKVLAVEADRTILLDEAEFVGFAQKNRLVVVAVDPQKLLAAAAA